jgi:hypothetical protein
MVGLDPPSPDLYSYQPVHFGGIAVAHILICSLSLFIPYFFVVAFPFLFFVLRSFLRDRALLDNSVYSAKMSTYTGISSRLLQDSFLCSFPSLNSVSQL